MSVFFSLSVGPANAGSRSFTSPSGNYAVTFTELEHKRFDKEIKSQDDVSRIAYRIDFYMKKEDKPRASVVYNDVYGWRQGSVPTPLQSLFDSFLWSPGEDIVILPEEGWVSAPGTITLKALALNPKLDWKETAYSFDRFVWTDDLNGVGDAHFDCDYGVSRFEGSTGRTLPLKLSDSPIGYELVSVEKNIALIKRVTDNCMVEGLALAPFCFTYDLKTGKEAGARCP